MFENHKLFIVPGVAILIGGQLGHEFTRDRNLPKYDDFLTNYEDRIFLYQRSIFNSEVRFLKWGEFRYGSSLQAAKELVQRFQGSQFTKKIEFLHTRDPRVKPDADQSAKAYDYCFYHQLKVLTDPSGEALLLLENQEIKYFEEELKVISERLGTRINISLYSQQDGYSIFRLASDQRDLILERGC